MSAKIKKLEQKLAKAKAKLVKAKEFKSSKEATSRKLTTRVRCGSCIHLKIKAPGLEAPCGALGKKNASPGCNLFTPNYAVARDADPSVILELSSLIADLGDSAKNLVAYAITNSVELERTTKKFLGYTMVFGETIALNLSQPRVDFVDCWVRASVIGITQDKKSLIFLSELNGKWAQVILPITSDQNFMPREDFLKHRKKLKKAKALKAPKKNLTYILPIAAKAPAAMAALPDKVLQTFTRKTLNVPVREQPKNLKKNKNGKISIDRS